MTLRWSNPEPIRSEYPEFPRYEYATPGQFPKYSRWGMLTRADLIEEIWDGKKGRVMAGKSIPQHPLTQLRVQEVLDDLRIPRFMQFGKNWATLKMWALQYVIWMRHIGRVMPHVYDTWIADIDQTIDGLERMYH